MFKRYVIVFSLDFSFNILNDFFYIFNSNYLKKGFCYCMLTKFNYLSNQPLTKTSATASAVPAAFVALHTYLPASE